MDASGPDLFKVLTWVFTAVMTIAVPVGLYLAQRVSAGFQETKRLAEKSISETKENRGEIHRLEVKMSSEYAPKSELADLRSEMREGFTKTQALIMELVRSGGK